MPRSDKDPPASASAPALKGGVRFSLAEILAEIAQEKASGVFAKTMLDQTEIRKRFKGKATPRARRAR